MMNYYPQNFYQNYSAQPSYANQYGGLNGKMVDSLDMVKASDVPIGNYGVFPKGDLSEIYIKTWNPNGTTNIITFKPVIEQETPSSEKIILDKISLLETKIDTFLNAKKEGVINDANQY